MPDRTADPLRCQASFPYSGEEPQGRRRRCDNTPTYIAREFNSTSFEPLKMSLCEGCKDKFVKQLGASFASLVPVRWFVEGTPGSPRAVSSGCSCPASANSEGTIGYQYGRPWAVNGDCPLHGGLDAKPNTDKDTNDDD